MTPGQFQWCCCNKAEDSLILLGINKWGSDPSTYIIYEYENLPQQAGQIPELISKTLFSPPVWTGFQAGGNYGCQDILKVNGKYYVRYDQTRNSDLKSISGFAYQDADGNWVYLPHTQVSAADIGITTLGIGTSLYYTGGTGYLSTQVWLGSPRRGMVHDVFSASPTFTIPYDVTIPANSTYASCCSSGGFYWMQTQGGCKRLVNGTWQAEATLLTGTGTIQQQKLMSLPDGRIAAVAFNGKHLTNKYDLVVSLYDGSSWHNNFLYTDRSGSFSSNLLTGYDINVAITADGVIWIKTVDEHTPKVEMWTCKVLDGEDTLTNVWGGTDITSIACIDSIWHSNLVVSAAGIPMFVYNPTWNQGDYWRLILGDYLNATWGSVDLSETAECGYFPVICTEMGTRHNGAWAK